MEVVAAGFALIVLAQLIRPRVSVMRFAKGVDAFKGLYQHMFQHYCRAMSEVTYGRLEEILAQAADGSLR